MSRDDGGWEGREPPAVVCCWSVLAPVRTATAAGTRVTTLFVLDKEFNAILAAAVGTGPLPIVALVGEEVLAL